MAVWGAVKTFFSGAGRWVVIGLLVVAAVAIPGFGWWRARKRLKAEKARADAAEAAAETAREQARIETRAAEQHRRVAEELAAERSRIRAESETVEKLADEERARIGGLDVEELATDWNDHFGDKP
jgi:uncharacterized protein HemX